MDHTENDDEPKAEITRCICGHEELQPSQIHNLHRQRKNFDPDFFIQCDNCHVWQHGYCVGIANDQEAPEGYYCEKCRPDYHVIVVRPSGRTSKYSPQEYSDEEDEEDNKPQPPKESVREERASRQRKEKEVTIQESSHDEQSRTTSNNNNGSSRRDRKRRLTVNSTRDEAAYEETLRRVLEESVHDDEHRDAKSAPEGTKGEGASFAASAPTVPTSSSRSKKRRTDSPSGSDESTKTSTSSSKRRAKNNNNSSNNKQISTSATSHAALSSGKGSTAVTAAALAAPASPSTQTTTSKKPEKRKRRHNASDDQSAASSQSHPSVASGKSYIDKPSKPRIPQSRISIPEMQKRVAAILEFIARTRIDLDVEERERRQLLDIRLVRYQQLYSPGNIEAASEPTSGSKSNGSVKVNSRPKTEEDSHLNNPKFGSLVDGFTKSLALMDTLAAKLSDWEQRYGAYGK